MKKSYFDSMKFLLNKTPPHLVLYVTADCNLRCKHCFYWKNIENFNPKIELSLEEIKRISEKFGHIHYLSITGGEPLLRKDLFEIIKTFYRNNRVRHLALHTNGFLFAKVEQIARQLIKECPNMIITFSLSLDQIGEKHNEIRRRKFAFENLVKTAKLLKPLQKNFNFDININSVFSSYNQNEIFKIHDFIENELRCYHAIGMIRGDSQDKEAKQIDVDKYRAISDQLEKIEPKRKHNFPFSLTGKLIDQVIKDIIIKTIKEKKMILPCFSGMKSVVIFENGEVYPCEVLKRGYGNIRDYGYNIKGILNTKQAKEINKFIKHKKCYCTFECTLPLSIIYSPKGAYRLFKKYLKYLGFNTGYSRPKPASQ